jgi:hypothetical protein
MRESEPLEEAEWREGHRLWSQPQTTQTMRVERGRWDCPPAQRVHSTTERTCDLTAVPAPSSWQTPLQNNPNGWSCCGFAGPLKGTRMVDGTSRAVIVTKREIGLRGCKTLFDRFAPPFEGLRRILWSALRTVQKAIAHPVLCVCVAPLRGEPHPIVHFGLSPNALL